MSAAPDQKAVSGVDALATPSISLASRDDVLQALRDAFPDRAAAIAIYRDYERALAVRGDEADDEIVAVYRDVVWRTAPRSNAPHSLPRFATPFVARRRERAKVADALVPGAAIVITGAPGVGKSRLSVAVAEDAAGRFQHGVRYIDLESGRDAENVLAQVLGVDHDAEALFLFDGVEHAIEPFRRAVAAVRERHPRAAVLATSRLRIELPGVAIEAIDPLPLPLAGASLSVLARTPSVALFIERAVLAHADLRLDADTAPLVTAVCSALDGLPLALEIAAAQLRFYTLPELVQRVSVRGLANDALKQTLRSSIELLEPRQRRAFRRLAAFSAPWTMAEAEACIADASLPPDAVLDAVSGLLERSLLQSEAREGVVRFRLLETMRRAAIDDGSEHERAAVRARAVAWCLTWLTRDTVDGTPSPEATRRLDERADLVRSVLDEWADDDRAVLRAIVATRKYWQWRGRTRESIARLEARAARAGTLDDDLAYGVARVAATHAQYAGDNARAETAIAASLAIAKRTGDPRQLVEAEHNAAILAYDRGNVEAARTLFLHVVDGYRALDAQVEAARVLANLAAIAVSEGRWQECERIAASLVNAGLPPQERVQIARLRAFAATMRGQLVSARAFADAAAALCDDPSVSVDWRAEVEAVRGFVALRAARPYEAIRHAQQALLMPPRPGLGAQYAIEFCGLAASAIRAFGEAAQLLSAAATWRRHSGRHRPPAIERLFSAERERVRAALGASYAQHAAVGASLTVERAAEIVFSLPLDPPGHADAASFLDVLTERERGVAALIGDGCTNREIAERLYLSVKTVERHLASIFEKLHITRRAQLAALVSRQAR